MKKLYLSSFITLMLTTQLFAAAQDNTQSYNEQEKVKRVFIRGNQSINEKMIKSWISTRRGDTYNPVNLDRDVRALFDTGHFEDVKVFVEDAERTGKVITYDLRERPIIVDVIYDMDNTTDKPKIIEELDKHELELAQGDRYNPVTVRKAARIIKGVLLREGRERAKVIPLIEQVDAKEVIVRFRIREESSQQERDGLTQSGSNKGMHRSLAASFAW